jgi:N-acetylglucosaminyl-diphospho-decaprenol L-rhamnosyltransferase
VPTERVEVLIPHWNRAERLRTVLDALREQTTQAPTCVVDNGSTDHTAELLEREFPEVRHLRLDRNYGFGRALNRGVDSSSADVVVFLNNDAVPDRRLVEEIVRAHARTGADMVAACLRQPSGEIDSLGVEVDASLNAYDVAHGEPYGDPSHASLEPLAPTGGAAGFRRDAFLAVGGFDEEIFAYLEDVDLGIRMRMEDMSCVLAYDAYAWHRHAGTLGSGSGEKNRLLGTARGYLLWKYGANLNRGQSMRALATDLVVYAGKAVVDRNLGAARGRVESARAGRSRPRPAADPRFARVPLVPVSFTGGLRRRLARRA